MTSRFYGVLRKAPSRLSDVAKQLIPATTHRVDVVFSVRCVVVYGSDGPWHWSWEGKEKVVGKERRRSVLMWHDIQFSGQLNLLPLADLFNQISTLLAVVVQ